MMMVPKDKLTPEEQFAKFDHDNDGRPGGSLPRSARDEKPVKEPPEPKAPEELPPVARESPPAVAEELLAKMGSQLPERQLTESRHLGRDNKVTRELERQYRRSAPGSLRETRPIL